MNGNESGTLLAAIWLVMIPVSFAVYAIPSIVAFRRRHPNRHVILVINITLGGTGIGWLGALVWALGAVHLSNDRLGSHGGESGLNLFADDPKPVRLVGPALVSAGPPQTGAPPLTIASAIAEIERLSALRAAGHLSKDEFATLKAGVLGRVRGGVG